MSVQDVMSKSFPVVQNYWGAVSDHITLAPTNWEHHLIRSRPFADVAVGDVVLLPIPGALPAPMQTAAQVSSMPTVWGKIVGKSIRTEQGGGNDLLISIIDGRQLAPANHPLPSAPGITLPNLTNVVVPTELLLTVAKGKLDAGQKQRDTADANRGNSSFVQDIASVPKGVSLDGGLYPCSSKKDIHSRMAGAMALTRLLPKARFAKFLPNILLDHELLKSTCNVYNNIRGVRPVGDLYHGFSEFHQVKELPVMSDGFGEDSRFQSALHIRYDAVDFSKLSLLDFYSTQVGPGAFKKGDQSPDGRSIIRTSLINKQKFMAIFFDPVFNDVFKLITDALENEIYIWQDFDNVYLLHRLSMLMQQWSITITTEGGEDNEPAPWANPRGCQTLLRDRCIVFMNSLRNKTDGVTESPHKKYYGVTKVYASMKWRSVKRQAPEKPEAQEKMGDLDETGELQPELKKVKKPPSPPAKKDTLLCYLSLTEAMGVKNEKGEVPKCAKKDCKFVHKKTVGEISLKSAKVAAKAWITDPVLRKGHPQRCVAEGRGGGDTGGKGE
jgi:hypothetical protein